MEPFSFFVDLLRVMQVNIMCDFIKVSSYNGRTKSSGNVKLIMPLSHSIEGKDVLLIEDIIDTGLTIQYIQKILKKQKPASLTTVCLLVNPTILEAKKLSVDHFCFTTNAFPFGYGMDYKNYYRTLPYIASIKN